MISASVLPSIISILIPVLFRIDSAISFPFLASRIADVAQALYFSTP